MARIAPYLWVLEDLQWADPETLAFLTILRPHLAECRLLLMMTARSAELRASSLAWETLQSMDQVAPLQRYSLSRLDVNAISELVRQVLSCDNAALIDSLARESAGVPLYLVETLKAWRDEAYLVADKRGGWRWQEDAPTAPAPHLEEAVIGHRLSRLSPAGDEVLAAAAVIGPEPDFDLLATVCTLQGAAPQITDTNQYLTATDDLLRLGFLVETDTGYRFSHEQVRRAAYHRLSPRKRKGARHHPAPGCGPSCPRTSWGHPHPLGGPGGGAHLRRRGRAIPGAQKRHQDHGQPRTEHESCQQLPGFHSAPPVARHDWDLPRPCQET